MEPLRVCVVPRPGRVGLRSVRRRSGRKGGGTFGICLWRMLRDLNERLVCQVDGENDGRETTREDGEAFFEVFAQAFEGGGETVWAHRGEVVVACWNRNAAELKVALQGDGTRRRESARLWKENRRSSVEAYLHAFERLVETSVHLLSLVDDTSGHEAADEEPAPGLTGVDLVLDLLQRTYPPTFVRLRSQKS